MTVGEFLTIIKDWLVPLSALLVVIVSIIDNSKKIAAKPLSNWLAKVGKKLNADISGRLDNQEAFLLNEFYQKHTMGKKMTKEQYEGAINMFEDHLKRGANSVNTIHLQELKEFYHNEFCRFKGER